MDKKQTGSNLADTYRRFGIDISAAASGEDDEKFLEEIGVRQPQKTVMDTVSNQKGTKVLNGFKNFFHVLFILFMCFVIVYLAIASTKRSLDNTFRLVIGNFTQNPIWLEDANDDVINQIYNEKEDNGEKATAYNMYLVACKKLMLAKYYGIRAISDIHVTAAGLTLDVMSNRTEEYEVAGTPTLNANQSIISSYQNSIYVSDCSNDAIGAILQGAIQFADRGYSDGNKAYKQKGDVSPMDDGGEVIVWRTDYAPEKTTASREYKDNEVREKCNFIINLDTISKATIKREYSEEQKQFFYTIDFELDCSDNEEGSATYYEATAIGDVLGPNMKSLTYSKLHIRTTMYENGYFINWDSVQEWTLRYEVSFIAAVGTALNVKREVFSYDPLDCKVVNFTK